VRLVCIGDSITAGQHLPPGLAWPYRLETTPIHVAGVPGDTTRLGLERFPVDVQTRSPRVVVVQFGHNDANRWLTDRGLPRVSPQAYEANLTEMVDRVRTFGAEPILCSLTRTARGGRYDDDVERYDGILREVAKRTGTTLADVRAAHDEGWLMDDGLHLTEAGQTGYAAVVDRLLR
jgi:lysophospholipase L1-like esterase